MRRRFAYSGPMALLPEAYGGEFEALPAEARASAAGPVAVVRVHGPLTQYQEPFAVMAPGLIGPPPDSYQDIVTRAEMAFASDAAAVVLEVSSPGGHVAGCFEAARSLRAMAERSGKPLIAWLTGQCCSAAYALACSADRIFASDSTTVGSVGVIESLLDKTAQDRAFGLKFTFVTSGARKADGQPSAGTTDDMVTARQVVVNDLAGIFHGYVAERRGLDVQRVAGLEAETMIASKAQAAGLIDAVTTFDETLALVAGGKIHAASAAQQQEEDMTLKDIKAKLTALAEGDDKEEAAKAKKALAAMEDEGGDDEDKAKAKAKAEGGDSEEDDEEAKAKAAAAATSAESDDDKDEEAKKAAAAAAAATGATSATASAPTLEQRIAAIEAAEAKKADLTKRQEILAARPDLSAEQISALAAVPTVALAATLGAIPKAPSKGRTYQPPALAQVGATRGDSQGGKEQQGPTALSPYASELDQEMGLASQQPMVRREGGSTIFSAVGQLPSAK